MHTEHGEGLLHDRKALRSSCCPGGRLAAAAWAAAAPQPNRPFPDFSSCHKLKPDIPIALRTGAASGADGTGAGGKFAALDHGHQADTAVHGREGAVLKPLCCNVLLRLLSCLGS